LKIQILSGIFFIMITVVDYGLGNIKSVSRALAKIGAAVRVSADPADINNSNGVVVPGVGAFATAMENIEDLGLTECLSGYLQSGKPYLGICLGMQMLFNESYEYGITKGFGVIGGSVKKFPAGVKIPHMGWNQVKYPDGSPMFNEIKQKSFFYFDHSFYIDPEKAEVVAGFTDYGIEFASAVIQGNVWGVQYHPEKSSNIGLQLLRNFVDAC
jgi:glutamine amidotransferase